MLDLYPRLADGVRVHRTPGEAYLHGRPGSGKPREFWIVNAAAGRLLGRCDGQRRLATILRSVAAETDGEVDPREVAPFLESAVARGHLELRTSPWARLDNVTTGSAEVYLPLHVSVELTARCNLACRYCYQDAAGDGPPELPTHELIAILEQWRHHGLVGVEVTGGEPLCHPGVWEVLDHCGGRFHPFALLTNGTRIDDAAADRLAAHGDGIIVSVSLDGPTAEVHGWSRGAASFASATAAVERLARRGVTVRVAMTTTPRNIWHLEETAGLARRLGARFFGFAPVAPFGKGVASAWSWDPADAARIGELEAHVLASNRGFIQQFGDAEQNLLTRFNCGVGHKNAVLTASGRVSFCVFADRRLDLGDARTTPLGEIFAQPLVSYLHDLKAPSPEDCEGCRYERYCRNCILRPFTLMERHGRPCRWAARRDVAAWLPPGAAVSLGSGSAAEVF